MQFQGSGEIVPQSGYLWEKGQHPSLGCVDPSALQTSRYHVLVEVDLALYSIPDGRQT